MYENPRWSPDGSKIAFTQLGYDGLYVMNHDGSSKTQISADSGVGYMYQWSADAQAIAVPLTSDPAAGAIAAQGKDTQIVNVSASPAGIYVVKATEVNGNTITGKVSIK